MSRRTARRYVKRGEHEAELQDEVAKRERRVSAGKRHSWWRDSTWGWGRGDMSPVWGESSQVPRG